MAEELTGETAALMERLANPDAVIVAHLCQNDLSEHDGPITLADLVECDFVGYEAQRLADWSPLDAYDEEVGEAEHPPAEFAVGDLIDAQMVTGFYITVEQDSDPPALVSLSLFPTPEVAQFDGQVLAYVPTWHSWDDVLV